MQSLKMLVRIALVVAASFARAAEPSPAAGDEVARGKPDPEPYRTACARLGVAPAATVVLEDAIAGVRSAEAAGCTVVAVPSVAPIEATPWRPVVARLADIDAGWLLALAARSGEG